MAFNLRKNPLKFEDASGTVWWVQQIDGQLEFSKEGYNTALALDTSSTVNGKKWRQFFDANSRYVMKVNDSAYYIEVDGAAVENVIDSNGSPRWVSVSKSADTTATYPGFASYNYSNSGGFPVVELIQSRGTSTVAAPVQAGETLGGMNFWGQYNNGSPMNRAGVRVEGYAVDTWTSTTGQARFRVRTVDGTTEYNAFEARATATDSVIEVGANRSGNRHAIIELVGDDTYTDFGARFHRENTGANAVTNLIHRGTGSLRYITQEAAQHEWWTSNVLRMTLSATGSWLGIGGAPVSSYALYTYNGHMAVKWDQAGATMNWVENLTSGATAQAHYQASSNSGVMNMGSASTAWSQASGSDWEILNGGKGYLQSNTPNGIAIGAVHTNGSLDILTGGAKNANIRARWSSSGNLALGYGDKTDAAEKLQLKSGNIKIDGTEGFHGVIYPDGTMQTSSMTIRPPMVNTVRNSILEMAPLCYWRLNETTGSIASDSMGRVNGTYVGAALSQPALITGDTTPTVGLAGTSGSYISVPYSSILTPSAQISISAIVKWQGTVKGRIVSKTETGGYALGFDSSNIQFTVYANAGYRTVNIATSQFVVGERYLLVGTYDGRYVKFYVNGTLMGITDAGATYPITYSVNNWLLIGNEPSSTAGVDATATYSFMGLISDVAVYGSAISAEQIGRLYRAVCGEAATLNVFSDVSYGTPSNGDVLTWNSVTKRWEAKFNSATGGSGSDNTMFLKAVTNTDLVNGIVTVLHGLDAQHNVVEVYDDQNYVIIPDEIHAVSTDVTEVDISSFMPITGTWTIKIIKSGGSPGQEGTIEQLNQLHDVTAPAPNVNDILMYDGTKWTNQLLQLPDTKPNFASTFMLMGA